MRAKLARLKRLRASYEALRKSIEGDIARTVRQRDDLGREQGELAAALERGGPFQDLALPSAIRRMVGLANRIAEADLALESHRRRAIACYLKARRAATLADTLHRDMAARQAREELAELTGRIAAAQVSGK